MRWRAVRADATYIVRHWSRSGQAVVISLVVPLILLGAFGFMFQGEAHDPPVLHVHDQADSNASRAMLAHLDADGLVTVREGALPEEELPRWMRAEGVTGALTVTPAYASENTTARASAVRLVVGDADAPNARVVVAAVERALTAADAPDAPDAKDVLAVDARPLPADASYRTFLLPGVLGLSVALSGISAGFSSMTELRHMGLLQRLAASPLKKSEWLLGRMLGAVAIGLVAAAVLVAVAWLMDPGAFRVGAWTVLLVIGGTLVFAGLGTLLGLAVERPEAGTAILNLALLPLVLLSGTFFSLDRIPAGARWLSAASPLTHLTDGLRADMLHGTGAAASAGVVLVMALVVLVVGTRLIRWTERS